MNTAVYTDYSRMEWKAEHSLGIPELDNQHKELLIFYNHAVANCSGDPIDEKEYFDKTINSFVKFLSKHFDTEEHSLFGRNYTRYEEHKLEHKKLLEKINFIKNEIENNRWEMKLHILAITLKDMLTYHINSYDMSAKEYFGEENSIQTIEVNSFAFQV